MAKGRKPAIGGLARPQGFLDDVVYPIVQKGARKVQNAAFTSNLPRKARARISHSARKIESGMDVRREISYMRKEQKNLYKMQDRLPSDNPKAKMSRSAAKYAKKSGVAGEKARAIAEGRPVRKMAKQTRRNYR